MSEKQRGEDPRKQALRHVAGFGAGLLFCANADNVYGLLIDGAKNIFTNLMNPVYGSYNFRVQIESTPNEKERELATAINTSLRGKVRADGSPINRVSFMRKTQELTKPHHFVEAAVSEVYRNSQRFDYSDSR